MWHRIKICRREVQRWLNSSLSYSASLSSWNILQWNQSLLKCYLSPYNHNRKYDRAHTSDTARLMLSWWLHMYWLSYNHDHIQITPHVVPVLYVLHPIPPHLITLLCSVLSRSKPTVWATYTALNISSYFFGNEAWLSMNISDLESSYSTYRISSVNIPVPSVG